MSLKSGKSKIRKGLLKIALLAAPFVIMVSGAVTTFGGLIKNTGDAENTVNYIEDFKSTQTFVEHFDNDIKEYSLAYSNEEIGFKEYSDKIEYFNTNSYAESIMKVYGDTATINQYNAILKQREDSTIVCCVGAGVFVSSALGILMALGIGGTKLIKFGESAKNDIEQGKEEVNKAKVDGILTRKVDTNGKYM